MARSSSQPKNSRRKPAEPSPPPPTWDELLLKELTPWRVELGGGLLLVAALLTLLGLLGLTESTPLNWWTTLLRQLFGWGSFVLAFSLGAAGIFLLLRRTGWVSQLRAAQVIGFELVWIALLPFAHQLTGSDLPDAFAGRGGGLVGWALSAPLLVYIGSFLTALLHLTMLLWGVALIRQVTWGDLLDGLNKLSHRLLRWSEAIAPEADKPLVVWSGGQAEAEAAEAEPVPPPRISPAMKAPAPPKRPRVLPPLDLLTQGVTVRLSPGEILRKREIIINTLAEFGIPAEPAGEQHGPAITQFGIKPGYLEKAGSDGKVWRQKIRIGQIAALDKDLALALAVPRLRIQAPVPGKGIVGIEVPNAQTNVVQLRGILESAPYQNAGIKSSLAVGLGLDVSGAPVITDVAKLPHLLIAGTTGSGKSVCLNALITNLICNNSPDQLRLVLIDPKKVEMIRFNGLPHLLGNVETDHDRVIGVLRWVTAEMDNRYKLFSEFGAKHLDSYNSKAQRLNEIQPLPYIVVVIDELADLMAVYPADIERTLCRLAQMARATGIHLIVATQRPSTDVITGLIKANFPARVAFAVATSTDSRVILDYVGAENLLGKGDMLFLAPDASSPQRVQGCFVSDHEMEKVVTYWQQQLADQEPEVAPWESLLARMNVIEQTDDLLERAVAFAQSNDTISTSLLQRKLRIGYPRAARLMEALYEMGMVDDPKQGGKTRRSLVTDDEGDALDNFLSDQE